MSLIKFSDVIRDVNWPTVWRYEYAENTVGPYNLTVAMGETTIYTHTLTLGETSHVKCIWNSNAGTSTPNNWVACHLNTYFDGWFLDSKAANCYILMGQTIHSQVVWLSVPTGPHTIDFKAVATNGTIVMDFYNAAIEVCRA